MKQTIPRALVTGGAGFIGSNLVRALLAGGTSVSVLDDFSTGSRANLVETDALRVVEGDVCDPASVTTAAAGAEAIFHLAASVGNQRSVLNPVRDAETNVIGTLRVLQCAKDAGIRKVVISSSAGIFGELRALPIREDHPAEPDTPYGATKLCAEKEGLAFGRLYGMDVVCLRYFNVYGPGQRYDAYGNVIPLFVFQALRGEPLTVFGDGNQTRDFVSVHDVVAANLRAAEAQHLSGPFNIGSGCQTTINDLVGMLQSACGLAPDVRHGLDRPGDVRHSVADIRAAQQAFGYRPATHLEAGLREYVGWVARQLKDEVSL